MVARKDFRLGSAELDPAANTLSGPEGEVHLQPKVMEFALYLAERAGEVISRDELIEALWQDFPGADQSLSNAASKLRQALGQVGCKRERLQTVPKRGYCISSSPPAVKSVRTIRLNRWIVPGVVALAIALLAMFALREPTQEGRKPSLAVLAFDDFSEEGDLEYFAQGVSEELMNVLGNIPELRVVARTSAFAIKDRELTVAEIGELLDVAHVLEGSVRRSEGRVRITVQLIDTATESHLWSETYERDLDEIFAIQDEIASTVTEELHVRLLESGKPFQPLDAETYATYLHAQYLGRLESADARDESSSLLAEVLARQPDYVPALTLLASQVWGSQPERAEHLLNRALAEDPDDGLANAYLALMRFELHRRPKDAAALMTKAVETEPGNGEVLRAAGYFSRAIGRLELAVALQQRAVDRDPLCTYCIYQLAVTLVYAGELDEAERWIRRYQALDSGGDLRLGDIAILKGDPTAALVAYDRQRPPAGHAPSWLSGRAMAMYDLSDAGQAQALLDELIEQWGPDQPRLVARTLAWLGQRDSAFEWLERVNRVEMTQVAFSPFFGGLHDDPRWIRLLERADMSPQQLAEIEFNPWFGISAPIE